MSPSTVLTTLTIVSMISREAFAPCETYAPISVAPVLCERGSCRKVMKYKNGQMFHSVRECLPDFHYIKNECNTTEIADHKLEVCFCEKHFCYKPRKSVEFNESKSSSLKSCTTWVLVMAIFAAF